MAMKYVGGGTYIHGVPARDLSDDEAKEYADIIAEQESLIGSKLYEPVQETKPAKGKKSEGSED